MRTRQPRSFAGAVSLGGILGVALLRCAVPTDDSGDVVVTIDAPTGVLVRGQTLLLTARAWRQSSASERSELRGLSFLWTTEDSGTALVTAQEQDGTALVTGVSSGQARIRAYARSFQGAQPGVLDLRVANTIEIDSVAPDTVSYGDQVTLYGVGFGRIDRVTLGETALLLDPHSVEGDPGGGGRLRAWVPYPATSGRVLAVAGEGFSAPAPDSTVVRADDRYEGAGPSAPRIDLNGSPVAGPDTLLYAPGLSLTGQDTVDGFRLERADTSRPLSVIVSTSAPAVTFFEPVVYPNLAELPAAIPNEPFVGPLWMLGVSSQYCEHSLIPLVKPYGRTAEVKLVRAFKTFPGPTVLLGIYGQPPGGYSVTVVDGYVTGDPRIQPDRFEENDYCKAADARADEPATHIEIDTPFADTLTLDNAYELDWIRFTVPKPYGGAVTMRTAARPFGAADTSDIGLYVAYPDIGLLIAQSHVPGSDERLTIEVQSGQLLRDFYVGVAEEAGIATRYALCIAEGSTCTLPGETAAGKR